VRGWGGGWVRGGPRWGGPGATGGGTSWWGGGGGGGWGCTRC
ncbi:DUF4136 domain-containing protein, partial [Streptomyces bambusae]|nr:DUF4136 domain-containing protein [Streptomyces bambusae]